MSLVLSVSLFDETFHLEEDEAETQSLSFRG